MESERVSGAIELDPFQLDLTNCEKLEVVQDRCVQRIPAAASSGVSGAPTSPPHPAAISSRSSPSRRITNQPLVYFLDACIFICQRPEGVDHSETSMPPIDWRRWEVLVQTHLKVIESGPSQLFKATFSALARVPGYSNV